MSAHSLAETAYRVLIGRILTGDLKPGDTLQESRLCDALEMSRTPVREAIARIRSEGLAEQQGRFFRLRRIAPEEIEEVFFLRATLEPSAVKAATGRLQPQALAALEADHRALLRDGPGDAARLWRTDCAFHTTLATAAGNPVIAKTIADLMQRTCIFDDRAVPDRFRPALEDHLTIIDAIRAGDGAAAAAGMAAHLDGARDAILSFLGSAPLSASMAGARV